MLARLLEKDGGYGGMQLRGRKFAYENSLASTIGGERCGPVHHEFFT
jgi:hypothetical protein